MESGLAFLRQALAATAALDAADRLGVLTLVCAGPVDPAEVARNCRISERAAEVLLAALAGVGVLERSGGGPYRLPASGLAGVSALRAFWDDLVGAIRDGRPTIDGATPLGAEAYYPDVVQDLGARLAPAAERAAHHLAALLHARVGGEPVEPMRAVPSLSLRVIDVGAGAAPWSLALAELFSDFRVTAVDLPAVLPATRRAVATAGRTARFRYRSGDLFALDLGRSRYDLAIAGNLCHLFDDAANRRLLGRLFAALRPGGMLAIIDALPNERLDGPRAVVLYALGLLLRTSRGRVYPFSSYVGWLRDAGYEAVERVDLGAMLSLITARRPGGRRPTNPSRSDGRRTP